VIGIINGLIGALKEKKEDLGDERSANVHDLLRRLNSTRGSET
jgi:hypothetical protein